MTRDRFLSWILVGIGVLVVVALILFLTRHSQATYGDDSTPQGALRNYILAIQKHDYSRAYSYLADSANKPTLLVFQQSLLSTSSQAVASTVVEISETISNTQDGTAVVQVYLSQGDDSLFSYSSRTSETATLVWQNGAWKVSSAPYPYAVMEPKYPAPVGPAPTLPPAQTPAVTTP